MSKEILVAFYNESDASLSNALWCRGKALRSLLAHEGANLETLFTASLTEPPGPGLWVWEGEPEVEDDDLEYADLYHGAWRPLTEAELVYFAENGCFEEDEFEDEEPLDEEEEGEDDDEFQELDFD